MKSAGILKVSRNAEIHYILSKDSSEYYASIWVNGTLLRVNGTTVAGFWRTNDLTELENTVMIRYGRDIELMEAFQASLIA